MNSPAAPPKKQSGFSLPEILVTIAMLGLALVVIAGIPNTVRLIGSSQKSSLAKDIVTGSIEGLRARGYDNLSNGTTSITDSRLNQLPDAGSSVVVSDCQSPVCVSGEKIKLVQVSVTWVEQGKDRDFSVTTLISKGGLQ